MFELVLIAVSLALDACAVSVSSGIAIPGFGLRQAVKMGAWFGAFQFLMPLAGWLLGHSVSAWIAAVDHWVSFGLLAFIGGRMVWEALGPVEAQTPCAALTSRRLASLAVATSIDALAVGVSLAFMPVNIWTAALVVGAAAFLLSAAGGLLGRRLGGLFQRRAGLAGGAALIAIGAKILLEGLL